MKKIMKKQNFKNYGYLKVRKEIAGTLESGKDNAKLENNGILVIETGNYNDKIPDYYKDNIVSKGAILNSDNLVLINGGDGKNGDDTVKDISDSGYTNKRIISL